MGECGNLYPPNRKLCDIPTEIPDLKIQGWALPTTRVSVDFSVLNNFANILTQ
jgi:hypothetical protein